MKKLPAFVIKSLLLISSTVNYYGWKLLKIGFYYIVGNTCEINYSMLLMRSTANKMVGNYSNLVLMISLAIFIVGN